MCIFLIDGYFYLMEKNKGRNEFGLFKKLGISMLSVRIELRKLMAKDFQRMVISGTSVTREIKQLFWVLPQKTPEEIAQNSETEAVRDRGVEDFQVF